MKITTLLLLTSSLFIASCGQSVDTTPDTALPDPSIKDNKIEISLDADHAVTDRDITITMRCTPLVSGKGRFWLESSGQWAESMVIVKSPVLDTLTGRDINNGSSGSVIPTDLVANQPLEQHWKIRLQSKHLNDVYHFDASISVDSIFVADSNRLYWLFGSALKEIAHGKTPYRGGAQSDFIYLRP